MLMLVLQLVLILLIVFCLGVFYLMSRHKRIVLRVCAVFVVIGFLIYTAAFLSSGEGVTNTLVAALRGVFSTARMFFTNDDHGVWGEIQGAEWLTGNTGVQIVFWLSHVSALMLIQAAVISLFGRDFIDRFRMRFGGHREVYIIRGGGKYALMLGGNIATHDASRNKPDPGRLIVFLIGEDDNVEKTYDKASRFGGICLVLEGNRDISFSLHKARLGMKNWRDKTYHIILMRGDKSMSDDAQTIAEYAKARGVAHANLHIYALASSEWERQRIEAITQESDSVGRKYPYAFHVISEVDLLIRRMIGKRPPFQCPGLGFDEHGVAARDFTVMILGFGEMGQRALLQLVMNGQFVGSNMRVIVVDRQINRIKEHFKLCYPSLCPDIGLSCKIDFRGYDVQEERFYKLLDENYAVDYVVVAMGGDEENKDIAMDIRLHYKRRGAKLPFIAVLERSGGLHSVRQDEEVFIFGCRDEIFCESVIIHEEGNRLAKAVHMVYDKNTPWHELDLFDQESNRAAADYIPAMLELAGLTAEEAKNMRSLAGVTEQAEVLAQTEHLRWMAFHAAMGYTVMSVEMMRKRYEQYDGERHTKDHLNFCRKDKKEKLHACLVPWEELDDVSEVYRELARLMGNESGQKTDFKSYDRAIVENIPKFLNNQL